MSDIIGKPCEQEARAKSFKKQPKEAVAHGERNQAQTR